jgi:hypothetical protein
MDWLAINHGRLNHLIQRRGYLVFPNKPEMALLRPTGRR